MTETPAPATETPAPAPAVAERAGDRVTDSAAPAAPIRWGVLGTGAIARVFTAELRLLPDHEVVAVGSRERSRAAAFAADHAIPRAYGSYAELAADADLDVVYVATPHNAHHDAAALCLDAGRGVLVEKPFTVTAGDADALVALARAKGLFAMEAMWTRFHPLIRRLRRSVREGAIGPVRAVYADFSFAAPYDPAGRLWSPALAGGALLDLGVYPLSFTWMLLGRPDEVRATAAFAPTGVDADTGIMLRYGPRAGTGPGVGPGPGGGEPGAAEGGSGGAVALLHCGLMADSPQTATVMGATGRIEVAAPFYSPTSLTLRPYGDAEPRTWTVRPPGRGYTYQAEEVARCLRAGLTESPDLPLDETVAILRLVETVRERLAEGAAVPAAVLARVPRPTESTGSESTGSESTGSESAGPADRADPDLPAGAAP
jgi:predicted dehydrogenase